MPARSRRKYSIPTLTITLILGFVMGPEGKALADDRGPLSAAKTTAPSRTYVVDGVTISWDLDRKRVHPPTAELAARISEALGKMMEEPGDGKAPAETIAAETIAAETLADGTRKVLFPARMMNVALLHLDDAGDPAGLCTGAEHVPEALSTLASSAEKEE